MRDPPGERKIQAVGASCLVNPPASRSSVYCCLLWPQLMRPVVGTQIHLLNQTAAQDGQRKVGVSSLDWSLQTSQSNELSEPGFHRAQRQTIHGYACHSRQFQSPSSVPPSPSQPVHSVGLEPFLLRARWLPSPLPDCG